MFINNTFLDYSIDSRAFSSSHIANIEFSRLYLVNIENYLLCTIDMGIASLYLTNGVIT